MAHPFIKTALQQRKQKMQPLPQLCINECGQSLPWRKLLTAVVAELSIHEFQN